VLRHGEDERIDDWHWLRDRDDPAVVEYLEAENAFTRDQLAHLESLRSQLFDEIKRRVRETDVSAPVRRSTWEYFTRTIEGREYPVHCRRPRSDRLPDADAAPGSVDGEEVLLDENARAAGADYFALRGMAISPDQDRVAFSVDTTGGERSTLRFRDLTAGTDLPDEVPDTYYGLAWANDGVTVLYVRPDEAMRPWQVWRHTLGTPAEADVLVHQEDDDRFFVALERARTGRYLLISSQSKLTSETHLVDADDPTGAPRLVAARDHGVEYHVEHHVDDDGDRLFVLTNADGAENFKLMVAPTAAPGRASWTEVVPHRDDVRLEAVDAFADHLLLSERAGGLEQLRVQRVSDGEAHTIAMADEVYSAWVGTNPEFETAVMRLGYTSLVVPTRALDYDVDTRTVTIVKQQDIADYDPTEFETWREWATAKDGTRVPISLVCRRTTRADGIRAPMLLNGYGSYEISNDPTFSVSRVSLLERGVVFGIAHVRGGGELGRRWYEDGKLDRKRNTFTDFVACAEHVVAAGLTRSDRLMASGGSAGGLLIGAVANLRPDLFTAMVAEVPFVDCLTTMLDASLPLTITEWEEWGNPDTDEAIYAYMKGYSPYDNVRATAYPALLVTAGLNDPRVQYWEPAKWVAKLRETATSDAPIYLKTEMGAGHHGPSGRYEGWKDQAFVLAFVLDRLGLT
jgi:oligopeptidase B